MKGEEYCKKDKILIGQSGNFKIQNVLTLLKAKAPVPFDFPSR